MMHSSNGETVIWTIAWNRTRSRIPASC